MGVASTALCVDIARHQITSQQLEHLITSLRNETPDEGSLVPSPFQDRILSEFAPHYEELAREIAVSLRPKE